MLGVYAVLGFGYAAFFLAAINLAYRVASSSVQSLSQTLLSRADFVDGLLTEGVISGRLLNVPAVSRCISMSRQSVLVVSFLVDLKAPYHSSYPFALLNADVLAFV